MRARSTPGDEATAVRRPSDASLIAQSLTDPQSFVGIFDRHFDEVHRYLHRRVGRDLADELSAETFVRAFAGRRSFQPRSASALPWLYGIATNVLRRHRRTELRRLRAYARSGQDPAVALDEDAVAARLDAADRGPALARALARLSTEERDTVCLVALGELTNEQAAEALGVPEGTIASRLHRARARLRLLLEEQSPTERITP
jgi:RNA polymerase sigma factor (sigma-70 family)